jgi:hypothetical protein
MFGRVRSVTRELAGQGGEELVEHLDGQLAATEEAAELAATVARAELGGEEAVTRAKALEHRGDEHRRELNVLLAASLAPPMDREDLVRLSRSVDDVLDNLDDLVIELDLYGITREPLLDAPLEGVGQGGAVAPSCGRLDRRRTRGVSCPGGPCQAQRDPAPLPGSHGRAARRGRARRALRPATARGAASRRRDRPPARGSGGRAHRRGDQAVPLTAPLDRR